MRLPFSKYWRTIPTKEITLYKVNRTDTNIELELVTTPEQIVLDEALCIGEEHVMNFINNTAEIKTTKNRGAEYI
jgi:hydroxyacyl-ACP dehydratase HTD2-like protein with hotdog domain